MSIPEGNTTFSPQEELEEFDNMLRGFFGNMYDYRGDNRVKNRVIVMLSVALIVVTSLFGFYVKTHHDVELRVIDTSQAASVPFRVLQFDNSVEGLETLYYYFFSQITTNLFTYNRKTLMDNWKAVVEYLDEPRMRAIMHEAETLITHYTKRGRFEKGNPQPAVKNVLFLDLEGDVKTVQVYADIEILDEIGNVEVEAKTYLITYKFFNQPPTKREQLDVNPLGIRITEWSVQEVIQTLGGKSS